MISRSGRACALLALLLLAPAPARTQGAGPAEPPQATGTAPPRAAPRAADPAANRPFTVRRAQITAMSGSVMRIGRDAYQIDDLLTPRPTRGQCYFERVRGRQARKTLRVILGSGEPIVVTPTGQTSPRGHRLATVTVAGRGVRAAMIEAGAGLPLKGNETRVPWCL